jgi:hypothetical protein
VSKRQSTNREVEEEGLTNSADESVSDSAYRGSSVNYGGRHYHTSLAPVDPPREPTIDVSSFYTNAKCLITCKF